MIQRILTPIIGKQMRQFPAVVLLGPRQCGKTTLARIFSKANKKPTHYFDLESPADYRKFGNPEMLLAELENDCVVIDEIQRMPQLFSLLRFLIDQHRKPGRFLLLGSASPDLVKHASESLAGRVCYLHVNPLCLKELSPQNAVITKHWYRGGFPGAWLARSDAAQASWMDSFIRTFVERDLNYLFGVTLSAPLMYRLWQMLAYHHGGIWNAQAFAKGLDVSPTTANKYLDFLEGAFMVRKLPSFHYNSRKRLVKAPKVYIRDSGVVNHLLHIGSARLMQVHPQIGFLWEGYALEQIIQQLPRPYQPYYYRTHDGAELDLVIVKGTEPYMGIEFKNSTAPALSKGFHQSVADLATSRNFVIIPGEQADYPLQKNCRVTDLITFLNKYMPK
jgi:uncharacterized protein